MDSLKVAIIGQGVIGISTALAIKEAHPNVEITLFADRPFQDTCSYGPSGLFRPNHLTLRKWGQASFERFAKLDREYSGEDTGIKLLSGHIQADDRDHLEPMEDAMKDIVYDLRWMDKRDMQMLFAHPLKYGLHYTAYAAEGKRYVPWMMRQLREKYSGVHFVERKVKSVKELVDEGKYDAVVNCAGLEGGKLAGDDDSVYPIRGIAIEVRAPWLKHFDYRDPVSMTIPLHNSVILGTLRQDGRTDLEITDTDRKTVWDRYLALDPTLKGVEVLSEWSGLRAARPENVRLEHVVMHAANGKACHVVHNYAHSTNGFNVGWGCAVEVLQLLEQHAC